MDQSFIKKLYNSHQACPTCPSPAEVSDFFVQLIGTLFADFAQLSFSSEQDFEKHIVGLKRELERILVFNPYKGGTDPARLAADFFERLPALYDKINLDVTAMFEGDPAAKSRSEVIRTYPGFYAIAAYRIAHDLHAGGVKGI